MHFTYFLFSKVIAKIVHGERREERKAKDFVLSLPNCRLFYEKIVQGECIAERKVKDFYVFHSFSLLFSSKNV